MKLKRCFFLIVSLTCISEMAVSQSLNAGINLQLSNVTKEQKNIGWDIDDLLSDTKIRSISYVKINNEQNYIALLNNYYLAEVNLSTKKYLGSWKLGTYSNYLFLSGEYMAAQEVISASENLDEFTRPENPLTPVTFADPIFMPSVEKTSKQQVGCFENAPLRYGDIESDGTNELVLFLSKDFIIFSPALRKITFAAHYFLNDEITPEEEESFNIKHDGENDPALLAGSMIFSDRIGKGGLFAAQRSISKMYFGHFLAADSNDIILWRKLYQSRLNKDPIKGFEKLGDVYVHYKLVNGEYQKQSTPEETIKGWLAAKQLTWQKGYPSKSECPGQEGQLIPEMHDPLLNDPDVLQ